MKKPKDHAYPLLAVRIPKELNQKRIRLEELGVDVPELIKQELPKIFDAVIEKQTKRPAKAG